MSDAPDQLPPPPDSVAESDLTIASGSEDIAPSTTEPLPEEPPPPPVEEPVLEEPPPPEPTPEEPPPPEPTPEDPPPPELTPEEPPPPEPTPEEPPPPEPTPEEPPPPEPTPEEPPPPEPTPEEPPPPEPTPEEPPPPEPVLEELPAPEPVLEEPPTPEPVLEEPPAPEPVLDEPPPPEPVLDEPPPPEPTPEEPPPPEEVEEPTMEDFVKLVEEDRLSVSSESENRPRLVSPPPEPRQDKPSLEEEQSILDFKDLTTGNEKEEEEEELIPQYFFNNEEEEEEEVQPQDDLSEPPPQEVQDNPLITPSEQSLLPQEDLINLEGESSRRPPGSLRNMPTDGILIGETDNQDWILEKMFRVTGTSTKDPSGGGVVAECIVPPNTVANLDPDRKGNWVLEKMFRQPGKKCDLPEPQGRKSTVTIGGIEYKNLNEPSNLYEQDGQWQLEKLRKPGSSKIGFGGTLQTQLGGCPGPCLSAQDQRFCTLGRTLMVACDSLTACDFIGTTECDLPVEEREPDVWDWLADLVLGLFTNEEKLEFDPNFSIPIGGEEGKVDEDQEGSPEIVDNCKG